MVKYQIGVVWYGQSADDITIMDKGEITYDCEDKLIEAAFKKVTKVLELI